MLTEYFKMNETDLHAWNYLYREFPQYYTWNKSTRKWTKRNQSKAVGRIYTASPNEGERYYLRILLNNVKGATSFTDLKLINNDLCSTFKESAIKRELIEAETIYHETMREAAQFQMPSTLRRLFATILLFGEPSDVRSLWNNNFSAMSEDFAKKGIPENYLWTNAVLLQIKYLLEYHHRSLNEYDLPPLTLPDNDPYELPKLVLDELNITVTAEDLAKIESLNENQKLIFDTVIEYIEKNQPAAFFVDGPAGKFIQN